MEDVCKVLLHFLDKPVSGIYNCGTGRAEPFNNVSLAVVNGIRASEGKEQLTLQGAVAAGEIEYIPFPEALKGKYQPLHRQTSRSCEPLGAMSTSVQ